jgi:hypothetical protein
MNDYLPTTYGDCIADECACIRFNSAMPGHRSSTSWAAWRGCGYAIAGAAGERTFSAGHQTHVSVYCPAA